MDDANAGDVDAGNFMRDLRERRFHPLAVRVHPDAHFEPAVRRHPYRGLVVTRNDGQAPCREYTGAVCRLFAVRGKPDSNASAVGLAFYLAFPPGIGVKLLARELQALLIVAAVIVLSRHIVVGHRASRNEIVIADLEG